MHVHDNNLKQQGFKTLKGYMCADSEWFRLPVYRTFQPFGWEFANHSLGEDGQTNPKGKKNSNLNSKSAHFFYDKIQRTIRG